MSYFQYLQEEAARLVVEGRISLLYEEEVTAIFLVEGETQTYRTQLKSEGTVSCTCTDWIHWEEVCWHILASQFCHHVHEVIR